MLVKLGGSVITDKSRPLSPRPAAVSAIAGALRRIGEPAVLVHGGGSFGHHVSVRYDMHTRPARYGPEGVAAVRRSMVDLHRVVLGALAAGGLHPCGVQPDAFERGGRLLPDRARELLRPAGGLTPVTYGDAVRRGRDRSYILSGDRIMSMLAGALRPRLCAFLTDVDGLLDRPGGDLILEAGSRRARTRAARTDVTGGMARKVAEARRIAAGGTDVALVSGRRPERLAAALGGKPFKGTLFRGA